LAPKTKVGGRGGDTKINYKKMEPRKKIPGFPRNRGARQTTCSAQKKGKCCQKTIRSKKGSDDPLLKTRRLARRNRRRRKT